MKRVLAVLLCVGSVAIGCGSDDGNGDAEATCLAGDPNCDDDGQTIAPPLVEGLDPDDPEGPIPISFGGFFYSDGVTSRLCDSLAESFPPQCGTTIVEIVGDLDLVLANVAESFGNPDDARVSTEQGVFWTDEWVNIGGLLQDGKLVVIE